MPGLTLNTQLFPTPSPAAQTSAEEEEEVDEVISLSPAVRAPIMNFRRSRSSLALSALSAHSEGPGSSVQNLGLDSIVEGEGKRYFGQDVNLEDLVAVNLENAFDRL